MKKIKKAGATQRVAPKTLTPKFTQKQEHNDQQYEFCTEGYWPALFYSRTDNPLD